MAVRFVITGEGEASHLADLLQDNLRRAGVPVSSAGRHVYRLELLPLAPGSLVTVYAGYDELDRAVLSQLRKYGPVLVEQSREEDATLVRIGVPGDTWDKPEPSDVELALTQACCSLYEADKRRQREENRRPWYQRLFSPALLLLPFLVLPASAQLIPSGGSSVNINSVGGSGITLGQKTMANSFPVVIASDQGSISVTIAANSSVNLNQVGGNAVNTGNGTAGTGTARVAIASDNTPFSVLAIPRNACGSTLFSQAWVAVPTSPTNATATTTCVTALIFTNTNASNQTVTVSDNQGSPVTIIATYSLPGNSTAIFPFNETQFTSGVKWNAGGAGITGAIKGWQ